jgi:hypothetical protein
VPRSQNKQKDKGFVYLFFVVLLSLHDIDKCLLVVCGFGFFGFLCASTNKEKAAAIYICVCDYSGTPLILIARSPAAEARGACT